VSGIDGNTKLDRRATLEFILDAWDKLPELRLGQLIDCACCDGGKPSSLFYMSNSTLVEKCNALAEGLAK